MKYKSDFRDQESLHAEISKIVDNLYDKFTKIDVALTENLFPAKKDSYHFITQLLRPDFKNPVERNFCSLLYKDIYRSEMLSAYGSKVAFLFGIIFAKTLLKNNLGRLNETELVDEWKNLMALFEAKLQDESCFPTQANLEDLVKQICQDDNLSTACIEALKVAGLEGRIFVENSRQEHYMVEFKEGYNFELLPYKFFLESGKWEKRDCRVLVVDGFIESVSEIDQLLKSCFETKEPLCLISQGFSEEVIATLYTNFKRKTISVIPLRLKTDVSALNVINDIGVVCGQDPISSMKGQLLSFVKLIDCPVVGRILVTEATTTIENSKTRSGVAEQIKMLLAKRENNQLVEDIRNLLDSRIRSLSPNSTLLYLPEMSLMKNESCRIKLDLSLRQTKSIINYGLIKKEDLQKLPPDSEVKPTLLRKSLTEAFTSLFDELEEESLPALSLYVGIMLAGSTVLKILSASGIVEIDFSERTA